MPRIRLLTWARGPVLAGVVLSAAACGGSGSTSASQASPADPATTEAASASTAAATTVSTAAPTTRATTTSQAPTTPAPTTAAPAPAPCQVAYVGDSIGTGILRNGLGASMASVGCPLLWEGGYPGMLTADGARALAGSGDTGTNVAVIVLGYAKGRRPIVNGEFPGLIDQIMEAAGTRLVVWPLLGGTPDCSQVYTAALTVANQQLQDATGRWSNLLLADYSTFIAAHPDFSENRCPHLLPAGYNATGAWLAGETRRLVDARAAQPAR